MSIPFQKIEWSTVQKEEHKGESGIAFWQTVQLGGLRIRIVEYSSGFMLITGARKGMWCIAWKGSSLPS